MKHALRIIYYSISIIVASGCAMRVDSSQQGGGDELTREVRGIILAAENYNAIESHDRITRTRLMGRSSGVAWLDSDLRSLPQDLLDAAMKAIADQPDLLRKIARESQIKWSDDNEPSAESRPCRAPESAGPAMIDCSRTAVERAKTSERLGAQMGREIAGLLGVPSQDSDKRAAIGLVLEEARVSLTLSVPEQELPEGDQLLPMTLLSSPGP